jgi:hypothetical protein
VHGKQHLRDGQNPKRRKQRRPNVGESTEPSCTPRGKTGGTGRKHKSSPDRQKADKTRWRYDTKVMNAWAAGSPPHR